jgi:uncharacterized protein YggE
MRGARLLLGLGIVAAVGVGLSTTRTAGQPPGGPPGPNHRTITVTGTATVTVKPDTARVSFAVRGGGNDLKAAVEECDKRAADVEKAIKALKLGGLEVKKGPINLLNSDRGFGGPGLPGGGRPFPGGGPGGPPGGIGGPPGVGGLPGGPGGFTEVSRTFTVVATFGGKNTAGEPKDIVPVADKILTAAVSAGATEPPVFNNNTTGPYYGGRFGGPFANDTNSRIELYRTELAQLRQDALKLAVADALANAKAAAGVANLTAKDIVTITDQNQNGSPFGVNGQPSSTGRGEVLGETELTVQVSVTFSY